MAVRYRSTFYSLSGITWKMEICDNEWGGYVYEFKTGPEIFSLSYKEMKDRSDTIFSSSVSIPLLVTDSNVEYFVTSIMTTQEERFTLQIYKNNVLYWRGILLHDLVQKEDIDYPYIVDLTFTDGLARLKDQEYNNSGTAYDGRETILDHILNCLNKTGLTQLYGTGDEFIRTCVNWYDANHNYTQTLCPLKYTNVDHMVFYSVDDGGTYEFKNCAEVLEMLLSQFNARIFMAGGIFWVVQPQEYSRSWTYFRSFTSAGVSSGSSRSTSRVTPTAAQRKAGGLTKYLPPLYKVSRVYKPHKTSYENESYLPVQSKYETAVSLLNNVTGGDVLRFAGVCHDWYSSTPTPPIQSKFYLALIATDLTTGTKYYLSNQNTNGALTWETTSFQHYYGFATPISYGSAGGNTWNIMIDVAFMTPELPGSNQFSVTFQLIRSGFYKLSGDPYTPPAGAVYDYECIGFAIANSYGIAINGDPEEILFTTTSAGTASRHVMNLPETPIGDGPNALSAGRLMTGVTFANSSSWQVHASTLTGKNINVLSIEQMIKPQRLPVEIFAGSYINSDITAATALYFSGTRILVPLSLKVDPAQDEVHGQWFNTAMPIV